MGDELLLRFAEAVGAERDALLGQFAAWYLRLDGAALPKRPGSPSSTRPRQNRHHPLGKICNHYATYRLTCDHYDDMRERAGGCCEICRTPEVESARGMLVVDHVHEPWMIRGLLCYRCNSLMSGYDRRSYRHRPLSPKMRLRADLYVANSWQMPDGRVRCSPHRHAEGPWESCSNGCTDSRFRHHLLLAA